MPKRVDQDSEGYDARLSHWDWCWDFGPEDFDGKHVVVFMDAGAVVRGTLTHKGTLKDRGDDFKNACDRTGCISLESNGFPALHDGHETGEATDLAVLKRLPPVDYDTLANTYQHWGFAHDVGEVVFVWDEQDYYSIPRKSVEPGCMAVVGTRLYRVLAVNGDWIVIDAGMPVTIRRDMAEEFCRTFPGRPQRNQGRTA